MNSQPARSAATEVRRRQRGGARPAQLALLAVAGTLLLYARMVAALGIGEPRELSRLFESLQVDVPVDVRGVEPSAVKVGVSFGGIDPALAARLQSRLHREWRLDPRGQYVLRISADAAIQEPLMQMRVEVGDDRIQAVRELTLLFDPAPVPVPVPAATALEAMATAVRAAPPPPQQQPVTSAAPPPAAALRTSQRSAAPLVKTTGSDDAPAATAQLRSQALSSADRWLRLPVAAGDSLETLAERARGEQTAIPLSMVAMLLRWLNPRAFDGIGGQPLVGAELRFPRPESLAAQLAISEGHWQVDDDASAGRGETAAVAAAADAVPVATAVSPASPVTADALASDAAGPAAAAVAGATLLAPGPTTTPAKLPAPADAPAPATAGGLLGSSALLVASLALASLLAVALTVVLRMRMPALQRAESLPGVVVARSLTASESAVVDDARALPADRFDLASLDLARHRQAEAVARNGGADRRDDARS